MEIKNCEQYVIAEIESLKKQVEDNLCDIETLEHDLEVAEKNLQTIREYVKVVGEAGDEKFMMLVSRQDNPEAFNEIAFATDNEFLL